MFFLMQFEEYLSAAIFPCFFLFDCLLLFFLPYYINDDESHFVPRNPCCDKRLLLFVLCMSCFDITLDKSGVFEIFTLLLGEPVGPLVNGFEKTNVDVEVVKCSGAQHCSPSDGQSDDLMTHSLKVLDSVHIFLFVSRRVSVSVPEHYHVVVSVELKKSYTASVFECGRASLVVRVL